MDKFKLEMSVRFKRDVKRCKDRGPESHGERTAALLPL